MRRKTNKRIRLKFPSTSMSLRYLRGEREIKKRTICKDRQGEKIGKRLNIGKSESECIQEKRKR